MYSTTISKRAQAIRAFEDSRKIHLLFMAEGVTAVHVLRPLAMAQALDKQKYRISFACSEKYRSMVEEQQFKWIEIHSIPSKLFLQRLMTGKPAYVESELREYVKEDLRVLFEASPDVIISDFRISLSISGELAGIPHINLTNAQWSPDASLPTPLPEHPMVRLFGVSVTKPFFKTTKPLFFKLHMKPINRLRVSFGLTPLGSLEEIYTRGTKTLYMDIPELFDLGKLSSNHQCIGPVHGSPDIKLPAWWDFLPSGRPVVFISSGSSGDPESTLTAVKALASMDVTVMVATAGRIDSDLLPANVFVADYIPGLAAAEKADLVVCNGGSGMVYQALSRGTPVLSIPVLMDQYYVAEAVERKNAGLVIRSGKITEKKVWQAANEILNKRSFNHGAEILRQHIKRTNPNMILEQTIEELVLEFTSRYQAFDPAYQRRSVAEKITSAKAG